MSWLLAIVIIALCFVAAVGVIASSIPTHKED